jgi:hypothetical protein
LTALGSGMKAHFSRYAKSYFVGALFVLLQIMISFNGEGSILTAAARASMSRFDWYLFACRTGIGCLPVIIAFLNGTVATDRAAPAAAPGP